MEYLSGETLLSYVRVHGPFPAESARPLACQIAEGLAAAHAAGIIHGDFKSSNVMLVPQDRQFRAVVTDFGLAHEQRASLETRIATFGERAGTPAYMAPEQLNGAPLSPAVDIYALGVVLFEMITGRLPILPASDDQPTRRDFESGPPSPQQLVPVVNRRWQLAIRRCLDRTPAHRPKSALEVIHLLQSRRRMSRRIFLTASGLVVAAALPAARYLPIFTEKPLHPKALASFKRAQEFSKRRNQEGLANAIEEYRQALSYEPDRAEIWIGLADAYSAMSNFQFMDPRQGLLKAREAATRAVKLDSSSGRAQGVLAYCMSIDLRQWLQAEPYFQRAVRLAPRDAQVRLWFGAFLGKLGRAEEAIAQIKVGLDEEPASLALNQQLATEFFLSGRTSELQAQAKEVVRLQPFEAAAHLILARAFEQAGDYASALRSCDKADEYHHSMGALCVRGSIEAAKGDLPAALKTARDVETYWLNNPFESLLLAALYARIGNPGRSVDILLAGCDRDDSSVLYAPQHPHLNSVRREPKYTEFLARIGLRA
jgi:Tfp pilus assembly protein PilF